MLDRLNNATLDVPQIEHIIRAELIGGNTCTSLGITAQANTPVLELCRKLFVAGHNPATRLEAYRGDVLCLQVRSIGEGARLEISTKGIGFIAHRAVRAAPPIRQSRRRAS